MTPATVLSNSFWVSWASSRRIRGQNEHIRAMVQGSRFPGGHAHCLAHREPRRALPPRGYDEYIVLLWTHPVYCRARGFPTTVFSQRSRKSQPGSRMQNSPAQAGVPGAIRKVLGNLPFLHPVEACGRAERVQQTGSCPSSVP